MRWIITMGMMMIMVAILDKRPQNSFQISASAAGATVKDASKATSIFISRFQAVMQSNQGQDLLESDLTL